ncbi:hypothetical protein LMG26846_04104 [Achromobacter insuavis]|uniref:ABC transporter substrate-binding protein n=1 Tax=Achromobacter insuavis TaxID=1287735 RepID=UPI00146832BB|nr:ABC transporter substrate-binding protein [Achromobacter insuavis]CAB3893101.1 hypothetical protein LMG26846_04104 [Achromobacter insuavis]
MTIARRAFFRRLALGLALTGSAAIWSGPLAAQPRDGGQITFLIGSLDSGWGPNEKVDTYTGIVWGQIADKLVHVDAHGNATPWLLERWEENADQTRFLLHIKPGVTFSDGTPVDAKAVIANIEIWAKGDTERGIGRLGLFPSATYVNSEAVDAHTVRVNFSAPTLSFIPTLGYHKTLVRSPASLALKGGDLGDLSKQLGSGPFVVQSWKEGDRVVLERRKDYHWGPQALGGQGPAHLDKITFKVVKDASLRASAVQSGQADVALNLEPQELRRIKAAGLVIDAPDSLGFVSGYSINTKTPHFDDVRVRQAIQHAINRQEILDTVFTEEWKPANTLLQSNVPEAGNFASLLTFDPDKSRKLLDDAGWRVQGDGFRAKNGETLRFTIYANPWVNTSKAVSELVTQQLQKVGIQATLQVVDIPTFNARVRNNDNVPLIDRSRSFLDAGVVGSVLTGAGDNWFRADKSDPKLNQFAADILNAVDRKARAKTLLDAQEYVLGQGLFVPTSQLIQRVYVQTPKLKDVAYSGAGYALYHQTWLDR